ncbi:hypothetical protein K458DRAFT_199409 [Lentithecium fluviatile CBS 122367]|uniref:Uncharacterized protein n=1 Tax=Lentithecium fluviatile CBS 122367 TaxID=1168545 RepID=A0A6G1J814_9PLEO|nr:hypothetical protein K458DRAFT_199409 [Lentithecium fluviatile CBS 122367]
MCTYCTGGSGLPGSRAVLQASRLPPGEAAVGSELQAICRAPLAARQTMVPKYISACHQIQRQFCVSLLYMTGCHTRRRSPLPYQDAKSFTRSALPMAGNSKQGSFSIIGAEYDDDPAAKVHRKHTESEDQRAIIERAGAATSITEPDQRP